MFLNFARVLTLFLCFFFGYVVTADQVTFQGCDINEARHLYDHLAVMCPIMVSAKGMVNEIAKYIFHSSLPPIVNLHFPMMLHIHVAGLVSCLSHLPWVLV